MLNLVEEKVPDAHTELRQLRAVSIGPKCVMEYPHATLSIPPKPQALVRIII